MVVLQSARPQSTSSPQVTIEPVDTHWFLWIPLQCLVFLAVWPPSCQNKGSSKTIQPNYDWNCPLMRWEVHSRRWPLGGASLLPRVSLYESWCEQTLTPNEMFFICSAPCGWLERSLYWSVIVIWWNICMLIKLKYLIIGTGERDSLHL